jgi:hypothetical protein
VLRVLMLDRWTGRDLIFVSQSRSQMRLGQMGEAATYFYYSQRFLCCIRRNIANDANQNVWFTLDIRIDSAKIYLY